MPRPPVEPGSPHYAVMTFPACEGPIAFRNKERKMIVDANPNKDAHDRYPRAEFKRITTITCRGYTPGHSTVAKWRRKGAVAMVQTGPRLWEVLGRRDPVAD